MNYVQQAKDRLLREYPGDPTPGLIDLYVLLVLVKGEAVTLRDVHDAWAVWRNATMPEHRSLVPFEELTERVQQLDAPYTEAIARAARPPVGREARVMPWLLE